MSFLDIDQLFQEEIETHNALIQSSGKLQDVFTRLTLSGFTLSDQIQDLIESIQKKNYDKARNIVQNAVNSISAIGENLISASQLLQSGVLQNNGQETSGRQTN